MEFSVRVEIFGGVPLSLSYIRRPTFDELFNFDKLMITLKKRFSQAKIEGQFQILLFFLIIIASSLLAINFEILFQHFVAFSINC